MGIGCSTITGLNSIEVSTRDIAHALSLLCRANGHYRYFYSVAQHSLNCAKEAGFRGYSERLQLAGLLHDASEAYISHITVNSENYVNKEIPPAR